MIWKVHREQNSYTLTSPSERNVTVSETSDDLVERALYGLAHQYLVLIERLEKYNQQPEIQYVLDMLVPELIAPVHDYTLHTRSKDRANRGPTFAARYSLPNLDEVIEQYMLALPTTISDKDKEQVQALVTEFLITLFNGGSGLDTLT